MQIQLKQVEIVAALKGYIEQKGIDLANKTVAITFTAGRKSSGLSADIIIEDGPIPGFSDRDGGDNEDEDNEQRNVQTQVNLSVVGNKPKDYPEQEAAEDHPVQAEQVDPPVDSPPTAETETAPTVKSSSLFN